MRILKGIMLNRHEMTRWIVDGAMLLVGLGGFALAIVLMVDLFWR